MSPFDKKADLNRLDLYYTSQGSNIIYFNYSGTEGQRHSGTKQRSGSRGPCFGYPQRGFVLHEKDEPWSPLAPPKAGKHRTPVRLTSEALRAVRTLNIECGSRSGEAGGSLIFLIKLKRRRRTLIRRWKFEVRCSTFL